MFSSTKVALANTTFSNTGTDKNGKDATLHIRLSTLMPIKQKRIKEFYL